MTKYLNKYRSESARAQWWDYGWNGAYFITICTADREHFFGEIKNGKMILSPTGVIADLLWHEITNHSKFVELGDFVVMPNHIHGILILDKPNEFVVNENKQTIDENEKTIGQNRFQNIGKNTVSSIIGSYKSAVTKHANRLGLKNGWQTRFHDHIIRNDAEYQRISNYIVNNPNKWIEDKFYSV
jgi:REP element-mobilizing transposase RayT